ncbi:MAG: hypothetical protein M0R44_02575 [Candidatus Marinimicrobia bacterium]|jgi:hypothetical protein|nr:hypothetical protein [Candidatus Neomarinimicrobiota bacterium]
MNLNFPERFPLLYDWLQTHGSWLKYASLISLITFVGTILLMPVLILLIPPDYFSNPGRRMRHFIKKRPLIGIIVLTTKNLIGIVFLLVGLVLLFIPGQGLLTILIGLIMVNFPGKYKIERRLVQKPGIIQAINSIRTKFKRSRLIIG